MGRKKRVKGPAHQPSMIRLAFQREGGKCFWCNTKVIPPWEVKISTGSLSPNHGTRDHLLPKSKGGPTALHNIVLSCCKCNNAKRDYLINPVTGGVICPSVLWLFLKES